jgi:hypothetical protein
MAAVQRFIWGDNEKKVAMCIGHWRDDCATSKQVHNVRQCNMSFPLEQPKDFWQDLRLSLHKIIYHILHRI